MFAFVASRGLPFELSSHALAQIRPRPAFSIISKFEARSSRRDSHQNTQHYPLTGNRSGKPVINFGFAVQVAFDLVPNDLHFQVAPLATWSRSVANPKGGSFSVPPLKRSFLPGNGTGV